MTVEPTHRMLDVTKHAGRLAAWYKSPQVDFEHLLLALLLEDQHLAAASLGLSFDRAGDCRDHLLQRLNEQLLQYLFECVTSRLADRGITFEFDRELVSFLLCQRDRKDSRSDAQQLDHLFHRLVADPLMDTLINDSVSPGDHVSAQLKDTRITFSTRRSLP